VTVGPDRPIRLAPVVHAEVTIVVDNFVDVLMAGSEGVRRYLATDFSDRDQLIAEHGFSALVTVERAGRRSSVLYDGGLTPTALGRNLMSCRFRSGACARSSSRTGTQTTTAG
jgi:7,8-dihydropterin-6-yl-methyl-4-(beta-D-ribofuranosyl)aminobenzene 5'-phosphate synthase